jgi:glycosyltransferase involved in cell wall biosynthesis
VHPSLHDSGGWVCLEAMAAGRPIICLDHGGPATQVTPETGVKVPVLTPEQVITDLAKAMEMLANDIEICEAMGQSGRERISAEFTWGHKADAINAYYKEICAR